MKNHLETFLSSLLFLSVTACSTTQNRLSFNEDKDVIGAVFAQLCNQSKRDGYYFVPLETSIVDPSFAPNDIEISMRQSLIDRNRTHAPLPNVDACDGLRRIDAKELDSYLGDSRKEGVPERWMEFYEKNEGLEGVLSLSLPGYSSQGDLAIVQVSSSCGWLCGGGSFWLVKKASGKWRVDTSKKIPGWQS